MANAVQQVVNAILPTNATLSNSAFDINPDNYLSIQYEEYLNLVEEMAIRDTKTFFKMKNQMNKIVKSEITTLIFKFVKSLLTDGTTGEMNGNKYIYNQIVGVDHAKFKPNYPAQEINNVALSLVNSLNKFLNDSVCEILMPERIRSLVGHSININHTEPLALTQGQLNT